MGNYKFDDNIHEEKQLPAGQRGIGCLMFLLLPTVSYVAASELLKVTEIRHFFYRVSPALFGAPSFPKLLWEIKPIDPLLRVIYSWTDVEANILLGLLVLLALSGLVAVIYAIAYGAVGPSKYGKMDAPPERRKTKKSR